MHDAQQEGDRWMLRLNGDVTGEGEEAVLYLANQAMVNGVRTAVIDISGVRFMNSSGIGLLIKLLTRFRNKGGEAYLLQPPETVRKLLVMTRLEAIFRIINSVDEARTAEGKP